MLAKASAACISLMRKEFDGLRYFPQSNFPAPVTVKFWLKGV
jgi:hypothetical protein